ncbi:MAG: diaminopimelate epimerase [Desulfatibacillaceae bacterium]
MDGFVFYKMSGSGNDFIVADNRNAAITRDRMPELAARLCRRKLSVGADGLILIENTDNPDADFVWRFFNSDGSAAEMCGNGGRCVARAAYMLGIAGSKMAFETVAGVIRAEVTDGRVKLEMTTPFDLLPDYVLDVDGRQVPVGSVNTGVPHVVVPVGDIGNQDITGLGRLIRFHDRYQPAGTNVNFAQVTGIGEISVRTYERGVEDETLACGTGAVASALIAAARDPAHQSPVRIKTRSGEFLDIHFSKTGDGFGPVFLEGGANLVYKADLGPDAM